MAERKRKAREEEEGEGEGAGGGEKEEEKEQAEAREEVYKGRHNIEGDIIGRDEQPGEPDPTLSVRSFGASASSTAVSRSNRTPGVVLPPVYLPHTSTRDSKRVKASSQSRTNNPVSLTKGVKGAFEADANGGKNARTLTSKPGPAPSAHPLAPQPLFLKFAPNSSSRLCRKKPQNDSRVEALEEEKQQSGE